MDTWAVRYGDAAAFVCVSCAGPALAVQFANELQLSKCTITYAERGPSWGQLGCNGFIILDASLNVVCPSTSAYLQVGEKAFRHVESLLEPLIGGDKGNEQNSVGPGQYVRLMNLSQAESQKRNGNIKRVEHASLLHTSRNKKVTHPRAQVSHTGLWRKSLTQVSHTNLSHKSLTQVSHKSLTSLSHKALTQVSHTPCAHMPHPLLPTHDRTLLVDLQAQRECAQAAPLARGRLHARERDGGGAPAQGVTRGAARLPGRPRARL